MEGKGITLPAIALRGLTILPEMIQHFDISREKSVGALESAMVGEQKVFLVTQRHPEEEDPGNFWPVSDRNHRQDQAAGKDAGRDYPG